MVENDLPLVLSWRNAEDVRKNMYTSHIITEQEHRSWWDAQQSNPASRLLIFEIAGEPAGVVTFSNYTGEGGTATWAFYSGDRTRRGVGSMMERSALEYAFEKLKVRRLECEVLSFNRAVVNFHVKHGFTIEGVFRLAFKRCDEYFDIYRLSMLADEWTKHVKPALTAMADGQASFVGKELVSELDLSTAAVSAYAAATGDKNPIHSDVDYARAMGFPGRVAHGMLVGTELSRIFSSDFPGPGTIYVSQSMEFKAPLFVDVQAQIKLKVISQIGRRLYVETHVHQDGRLCVTGIAVLMIPKGGVANTTSSAVLGNSE
ncbi:MAG TPA: UDP-4-amino-4,6-dideoxy-N-acetyl-beta-L-altrosamine N-acetyltransferase [Hyphomicrobiaceae bacterium]